MSSRRPSAVVLTEALLLAAKAGDGHARAQLSQWMAGEIVRFYRRQGLTEGQTAQRTRDCAQAAITDLLNKLDQAPSEPAAFRAWTLGFARTEVKRLWTRDKQHARKRDALAVAPAPEAHGLETELVWARALDRLRAEVERLPTPYRQTFELVCEHESAKEVAKVLGVPAGTVRRRFSIARRWLLEAFEDSRLTASEFRTPAPS